jgi:hypothetical protein
MSIEGHEQINILLLNDRIGHFTWRPENLCVCTVASDINLPYNVIVQHWIFVYSSQRHVAQQHTHMHCYFSIAKVIMGMCHSVIHCLSCFTLKFALLFLYLYSVSQLSFWCRKWWSHQSVYPFHIFISVHCYQTARSSGAHTAFVI